MRSFVSLFSALALTFVLLAQTPATKSGAVPRKAGATKKTTPGAPKATPAAAAKGASTETFTNDDQRMLYTIGMILKENSSRKLATLDLTPAEMVMVKRGMLDAFDDKAALKLDEWGPKINDFAKGRMDKKSEAVKATSAAFLTKEAAVAGTTKAPSGFLYREMTAGTGPTPTADDTVKVHYRGTLIDGTEFDSSYSRNMPAEFPLKGVIPCWTEGVQMIKTGGKARLFCPSSVAYGDEGRPPQIPGGATLIFEIELLEIVKPAAAAPATPPQN